ncbi:MAG: hypothetical protein AAGA92_05790 [Planctomycetota bacterium]
MKRLRLAALLLAALMGSAASGGSAMAQYGVGNYGAGFGFGYGFADVGNLYRVLAQNVPYYAAFPPVYYSVPVARTYGYSPFAYPPGFTTPEVVAEDCAPAEILNPFVPSSSLTEPQADEVTGAQAPAPLVVMNPYVVPASENSRLASLSGN